MSEQPTKLMGGYKAWVVKCPKHGEHHHSIHSTIKGAEGAWCQICWLESLGPPLEAEYRHVPFGDES